MRTPIADKILLTTLPNFAIFDVIVKTSRLKPCPYTFYVLWRDRVSLPQQKADRWRTGICACERMVCQPSKLPEEITTTLRGAAVILGNHHRCDTCSVLYEHPVQIGVDWTSRCEANITIAPMPVSVFSAYSTFITTLKASVKWEGFTSSPVATSSLEKRINVAWPQGIHQWRNIAYLLSLFLNYHLRLLPWGSWLLSLAQFLSSSCLCCFGQFGY